MWIQFAGVHDSAEAEDIVAAGATHLGLPLRLPDGREDLGEADARALIREFGERIDTVLITYQTDADDILRFAAWLGVRGIQLHGAVTAATVARLRALEPNVFLMPALVIDDAGDLRALLRFARDCADHVDAFITDTFDPATGRRGATGRVHDWAASATLASLLPRPLMLAGGLMAENVAAGIAATRAYGVDAHTGVEDPRTGRKCPRRMTAFVAAAHAAWAAMPS